MKLVFIVGIALIVAWMFSTLTAGSGSGDVSSSSNNLDNFTEAQAQFEGFYLPGSVAQRTNNPGNIGTYGGKVGSYIDPGAGWDALYGYDQNIAQQHPDWSILQFITYYLTGSPNGTPGPKQNPQAYADYEANYLGVPVTTSIGSLFNG